MQFNTSIWRCGIVVGAGIAALLACTGCSRGRSIAEASGSVSFNGAPVKEGTIRFFPREENMGQGAAANVTDGRYAIAAGEGLVAGPYVVALTAVQPTGRQIPRREVDPGESPTVSETVQILPERYTVPGDVTAALRGGANIQDFHLAP